MKTKISIIGSSDSSSGGGYVNCQTYAKALNWAGFDAVHVKVKDIGSPDILLLNSIGMNGETKDTEKNIKRVEKILSYYGRIPIVLVSHDILEQGVYKHSFPAMAEMEWSACISVEPSKLYMDYVRAVYPNAKGYFGVRHPWEFTKEHFGDRGQFSSVVANLSRIAGTKHTDLVLDIAAGARNKQFIVASKEKGIYWYQRIKNHPHKKYATFSGEKGFDHYYDVLRNAGFLIDLCYYWTKYGTSGRRTQYTVLEAINCGCIPIGFDVWRWHYGYEGIWLPSPEKQGNKFCYDTNACSELVAAAEYDFDMAKRNYEHMQEIQDYRVIGKRLKQIFDNLTI